MVHNNQEPRCNYWATRLSVRSFARTAHSFTCSALIAALVRLLAHFAHSLSCGKVNDRMGYQAVLNHSGLENLV